VEIDDKFIVAYKDHVNDLLYLKDSNLSSEDMDELNQEVFYKALLYRDYYDKEKGSVSTWLGLLVTHVYDRYIREQQPYDVSSLSGDDSTEAHMVTKDDLLQQQNDYYYYSNKEEIDKFIELLPQKQRKVVYLKLILGFSYAEISSEMGSTESTNRSNFEAGIKNLKRLLESDSPEELYLVETKILKPYGDKYYSGDWAWRPKESPDRSAGAVKVFSPEEVRQHCQEHNLNYIGN